MRRDESGHALPAWLQDQPATDSEAPPARRGFRRAGRSVGESDHDTHSVPDASTVPDTHVAADRTLREFPERMPSDHGPVGSVVMPPAPLLLSQPSEPTPAGAHPVASVPFGMPHPAVVPAAGPAVVSTVAPAAQVENPAVKSPEVPAPGTLHGRAIDPPNPVPPPVMPQAVPAFDPVPDVSSTGPIVVVARAAAVPEVAVPADSGLAHTESLGLEPEPAGSRVAEIVAATATASGDTDTETAGEAPEPRWPLPEELGEDDHEPLPFPVVDQSHPLDHQPSNVDLASGVLVRRSRRSPSRGWRRGVHRLTKGLLDPGESVDGARHEDLVERIRQPIPGDYRVAVLSLKGGVGKTTTTIGLGSTFASLRGDCVVAVDANPDFGTLAQRIPQQTESTVRDLLAAASTIQRYSDVRAHTSQAPSRLEVLASERDPAASEAFSETDYRRVVDILQVFYNIILTDCGTGIMHSAMRGVLDLANALVLVGSPAVDGARSAAATLDWLQAHGYDDLVERTVVVISSPRPGSSNIDMEALEQHFLARCRALQVLPFDEHLAEGAEIDLDRLRPATRRAFVELAAMVADDFPPLSGRHSGRW